jgi:hypothetical protein
MSELASVMASATDFLDPTGQRGQQPVNQLWKAGVTRCDPPLPRCQAGVAIYVLSLGS